MKTFIASLLLASTIAVKVQGDYELDDFEDYTVVPGTEYHTGKTYRVE